MESTAYHLSPEEIRRPKNWLVESILVTVFCCLPFGIAGIVYASQVNTKFDLRDYPGAERASREARKWTLIGLLVGGGWVVIVIVLILLSSVFMIPLPWHHGMHALTT